MGAELKKAEEAQKCPRCGTMLIETHCKTICQSCGYLTDCNDQWE